MTRYAKGTQVRKGLINPNSVFPSHRSNSAKGPCQRLKLRTFNSPFFSQFLNLFADFVEFLPIRDIIYNIIISISQAKFLVRDRDESVSLQVLPMIELIYGQGGSGIY